MAPEDVEEILGAASQERVSALVGAVFDSARDMGLSLLEVARACDACAAAARHAVAENVAASGRARAKGE